MRLLWATGRVDTAEIEHCEVFPLSVYRSPRSVVQAANIRRGKTRRWVCVVVVDSFCCVYGWVYWLSHFVWSMREKNVCARSKLFSISINFLELIGLKVRMPRRRWDIRTFDPDSHWLRKEGASASRVSTWAPRDQRRSAPALTPRQAQQFWIG